MKARALKIQIVVDSPVAQRPNQSLVDNGALLLLEAVLE